MWERVGCRHLASPTTQRAKTNSFLAQGYKHEGKSKLTASKNQRRRRAVTDDARWDVALTGQQFLSGGESQAQALKACFSDDESMDF